jgi:hypothetical protein
MLFPVVHGFGDALEKVTTSKKWRDYFKDFTPNWHFVTAAEYEHLLTQSGFNINRVALVTQDETYPSSDVFRDSISHWLPHVKVLPANLQDDFLKDLVNAYSQQVPTASNGELHYYVDSLQVMAQRG